MAHDGGEGPAGAKARLCAAALDGLLLAAALAAACAAAFAWLLIRTEAGRYDVAGGDGVAAAALAAAAAPAWAIGQAARLWLRGATAGQARLGLAVAGSPPRRAARLLLHPLAGPLWIWLAATAWLAGAPLRPALAALAAAVLAPLALGTASLAALRWPRWRMHERLTGARLVRRP